MRKIYLTFLFSSLIVLKIIDIWITYYGLSLGGIELSLLGFNTFSMTFNVVIIIVFGLMIYFNSDNFISLVILFGLLICNLILVIAFINNLNGVVNYLITV